MTYSTTTFLSPVALPKLLCTKELKININTSTGATALSAFTKKSPKILLKFAMFDQVFVSPASKFISATPILAK